MKVEHLKRLPALIISALMLASIGTAYANKPYLKTYGGDVMTGGWYKSGNNCDTSSASYYQDSNYPQGSADARNGGIDTYANQNSGNSGGGSSSQYGVFALGTVDNNSVANGYGFYSAGQLAAGAPTPINTLTFANNNGAYPWGGQFEGNVRQSNCIPDYYSEEPASAPPLGGPLSGAIVPTAGGTFSTPSFATCSPNVYCLTNGAVTINPSTHLTIYVKGNLYIGDNITYAAHDANSIPKFALVVSGSIYISPSVTQLDGLYIAEPATNNANTINADDGDIWTCHPSNTGTLDYFYPPTCTSPLVVNGALIAKQVNFLRVRGDIGSASSSEDSLSGGLSSTNIAEIINYSPDVIMGGGFFSNSSASGSATGLPIDSLTSLPPVF